MAPVRFFSMFYFLIQWLVGAAAASEAPKVRDSALIRAESVPQRTERTKTFEHEAVLDVVGQDGTSLREQGAQTWVQSPIRGNPKVRWPEDSASLIITSMGKADGRNCGQFVNKVIDAIKFHMGRHGRGESFSSESEARLFTNLKDGVNGRSVLSDSMRVMGNYTLAEGIMSGSLWTIDNQNHYISCEQNLKNRLEEHERTENGDALLQGDMAVPSSLCHYRESATQNARVMFPVGTDNCLGILGCQFVHAHEATHFCSKHAECSLVEHKPGSPHCDSGLGCYMPKKGDVEVDQDLNKTGGKSYIKHCPGSLLQAEDAVSAGLQSGVMGNRWKDGAVNYCYSAEASQEVMDAFDSAVKRVQEQVPCLRFINVQRIDDTRCNVMPSIIVQSKPSGCWSYLGQVSGQETEWKERSQPLNLDRGCEMTGIALHQLAHALGMVHENTRADRGKFIQLNKGNITKGKEAQFTKTSDVQKFAWSGLNQCKERMGTTVANMTKGDCKKLGGTFNKTDEMFIQCSMELCEDGKYFPAPEGRCRAKVASMFLKMERQDCKSAMGTPATPEGEYWQWTDCKFAVCTDMGLQIAKPFSCANKMAYGYIETSLADCKKMEGSVTTQTGQSEMVNCYFDYCSGEFDAPFDFMSLMLYSPYAWSKTGSDLTAEPTGEHSAMLTSIMGQRMGFSGLDVFHLGHMYNCWDKIKPDFDSKELSRRMITGEFFEYEGTCQDSLPSQTGFDVHGERGLSRPAACHDLQKHCNNATTGELVKKACPVSCFVCMPSHGTLGSGNASAGSAPLGKCFDAINTGIRFKEGPKATCKDLTNYCNHTVLGPRVSQACKLSCGLCDARIVAPFIDPHGQCNDSPTSAEPQFTIKGKTAECKDLASFCVEHPDSPLIQRKCPATCGFCGSKDSTTTKKIIKSAEVKIPGDEAGCSRRRRMGFCSSRRRRNV